MQRYNQIRWYVVFEMYSQIGNNYPCLAPWLAECELWGHSPAGIAAIRKVVRDHGETLKLEIAIGMDVYRPFVEATYVLEGDGVLVSALADILDKLAIHVALVRGGGAAPQTRVRWPRLWWLPTSGASLLPHKMFGWQLSLRSHYARWRDRWCTSRPRWRNSRTIGRHLQSLPSV